MPLSWKKADRDIVYNVRIILSGKDKFVENEKNPKYLDIFSDLLKLEIIVNHILFVITDYLGTEPMWGADTFTENYNLCIWYTKSVSLCMNCVSGRQV